MHWCFVPCWLLWAFQHSRTTVSTGDHNYAPGTTCSMRLQPHHMVWAAALCSLESR